MKTQGFTLLELMVAIGILVILLAIVLVAINPSRQFAAANNTKRRSDVKAILDALNQYTIANKGQLPTQITTSVQTIANTGADICSLLVPTYLAALPVDPLTNNGSAIATCSGTYTTNYTIVESTSSGRLTIAAPAAQNGETISIIR